MVRGILRPSGYHRGKIIADTIDEHPPALSQPVYRGFNRITWGKPQRECQARETGLCPRCNFKMDIGRDDKGHIFGGLCFACGWSF